MYETAMWVHCQKGTCKVGTYAACVAAIRATHGHVWERAGAERVFDLGDINDYEKAGLELLKPELKASIDKVR